MFPFGIYTSLARILPTFVAVLPLGLIMLVFLAEQPLLVSVLFGLLTVGGTAIGSQFGRELGYKAQPGLWQGWGGPPTTRLLRHHHLPGDIEMEPGLRQSIEEWVGWPLPTEQQEKDDPDWADAEYQKATKALIDATRDSNKFPLVFAENVNYGFRRNLWGLRVIGGVISAVVAILSWALLLLTTWGRPWPEPWWDIFAEPDFTVTVRIVISIASTILVVFWVFFVKPSWIKASAEMYALRLMESVRILEVWPESHWPRFLLIK